MGRLIRALTFERNIVGQDLLRSADKVFSILDRASRGLQLESKVDRNIATPLSTYLGLLYRGEVTDLGRFVLQAGTNHPRATYRWLLTRSLDRYQFPNGTASPNNRLFREAGVVLKPLRFTLELCLEVARLDARYPYVLYRELLELLVEDANWTLSALDLAKLIVEGRSRRPAWQILAEPGANKLYNSLEIEYGAGKDQLNGLYNKTFSQLGLFWYPEVERVQMGIGVDAQKLGHQDSVWLRHILANKQVWRGTEWPLYLADRTNELPLPPELVR